MYTLPSLSKTSASKIILQSGQILCVNLIVRLAVTKLGVLLMLGVTLAVQGGFVAFFLYLRRRAKRMADVELDTEWSDLQRSPKTT